MNTNELLAALSLVAALNCAPASRSAPSTNTTDLSALAVQAVSPDRAEARSAIAKLRDAGPAGLQALVSAHAEQIQTHSGHSRSLLLETPLSDNAAWERLRAALDVVGQQRDCYVSQLYWYTDFEQAKAAAKAAGKPILSLRLLGRLDEEFSCANSRFFRTTLYANRDVAHFLRANFVLHWKSVRPVPRVTIDFGDGRKIERTITGNSIHYVLDAQGRVIDALPGLYGPRAFLCSLALANDAAQRATILDGQARADFLRQFHRDRIAAIATQWADDLDKIGKALPAITSVAASPQRADSSLSPSAVMACRLTVLKSGVENPILSAISVRRDLQPSQLEASTDEESWGRIASLHAMDAKLDARTAVLIRAKNPTAAAAGRLTRSKAVLEDPLLRVIRNLETSIAEDTVRNEYLLHAKIHEWLSSAPASVDQLNTKVYAELFLTPDSDPWLGLVPRDTFTALENNGLIQPSQ
jgi:hypothetical protein